MGGRGSKSSAAASAAASAAPVPPSPAAASVEPPKPSAKDMGYFAESQDAIVDTKMDNIDGAAKNIDNYLDRIGTGDRATYGRLFKAKEADSRDAMNAVQWLKKSYRELKDAIGSTKELQRIADNKSRSTRATIQPGSKEHTAIKAMVDYRTNQLVGKLTAIRSAEDRVRASWDKVGSGSIPKIPGSIHGKGGTLDWRPSQVIAEDMYAL